MIDYILNLLIAYKYWLVIGGALIEGEVILLVAGMAAYHGHLSLFWVTSIAFAGAVFHDNLLFLVGKRAGAKLLDKYPRLKAKSERVFRLFHRYKNLFIFSFRFVYGIRTVTPLLIGTSQIDTRRYIMLTLMACLVWSTVVCTAGYWFASVIEDVIDVFVRYEKYIALGALFLMGGIWGWRRFKKKRKHSSK